VDCGQFPLASMLVAQKATLFLMRGTLGLFGNPSQVTYCAKKGIFGKIGDFRTSLLL